MTPEHEPRIGPTFTDRWIMKQTFHRRTLPTNAIGFSTPEGRALFSEAMAAKGMDGYFPLAEQFHTQSDPAFCGPGSLVVALNALAIDPGRPWKGPWRWFSEDMLDCCVPLADVREQGVDIDTFACLARCNGAAVEIHRGDVSSLEAWRDALAVAAGGEAVVVASYDRAVMGQTGSGHFSPIGGYHAGKDLALILDVARFKYPPHWAPAEQLFSAMGGIDPATGQARGWLIIRRDPGSRQVDFRSCCVAGNRASPGRGRSSAQGATLQ